MPRPVSHPQLADKAWVQARVDEGLTDQEIADIVGNGCYATTVQYWRGKHHGIKKPGRGGRWPIGRGMSQLPHHKGRGFRYPCAPRLR